MVLIKKSIEDSKKQKFPNLPLALGIHNYQSFSLYLICFTAVELCFEIIKKLSLLSVKSLKRDCFREIYLLALFPKQRRLYEPTGYMLTYYLYTFSLSHKHGSQILILFGFFWILSSIWI